MKNVKVPVNCNEETCGKCEWQGWEGDSPCCVLFEVQDYPTTLKYLRGTSLLLRHPLCLANEIKKQ